MTDISKVDFDYGSVDEDTAGKLEYYAKAGKTLLRKSQIEFIAKMGEILSGARTVLAKHGDGKFIKWAMAEFDISKDTIYRYVNAWDRCLSHSATNYLHWTASALYLASAEDFPKPAMKKLEKLPPTDLVRTSDVKRIVQSVAPKAAKTATLQKPNDLLDESLSHSATNYEEPQHQSAAEDLETADDSMAANPETGQEFDVEPDPPKAQDQAKLNKKLAADLIAKAVRAVDDLHNVKPNKAAQIKCVKLLQEAGGLLW